MRWRPRLDTLFARLLLMQLLTVLAVVLVLGALFYMERNQAISRLVAMRWAPVLQAALATLPGKAPGDLAALAATATPAPASSSAAGSAPGAAADTATPLGETGLWRRDSPPPRALRGATWVPRLKALQQTLRERGVPVQQLVVTRYQSRPVIWVAVALADGRLQWLGFADDVLEPLFPARLGLALLLASLLVLVASALTARRLAAPLARLRERMAAHTPGAGPPPAALPARGPAATVELAQIEQAWQLLAERLALHESERQLLLAGVSHDLRSPLARVRMAAELLPEAPGVAERRAAIVRNVEVADRLLQSFLDLVRADTVALDETVDLAALARQVLALRSDAGLQLEAPASLRLERANALALERVLHNLIDNALHHGAAPVVLRLGGGAGAPAGLGHPAGRGGTCWIEVQDAGPGIPEAERAQVLRAFARGDRSRGRPGTGLGLAVVVALARRMGGGVQIRGGPGDLRVRVTLDRTAARA
ncbi:sensor histidine kinase [Aquabacterium sp. OR-4]|uniref:sensor histidine kinase n=1 Tax=Aquabacterium sp. OR-4 TaxID=2978127 RepID=UPI0021B29FBB|nr:ATP-binding protein [Aquabacterium sp. OR-4]MDT7837504.1 ATP-binding protein [Aquabacterium sp. OR-4]